MLLKADVDAADEAGCEVEVPGELGGQDEQLWQASCHQPGVLLSLLRIDLLLRDNAIISDADKWLDKSGRHSSQRSSHATQLHGCASTAAAMSAAVATGAYTRFSA